MKDNIAIDCFKLVKGEGKSIGIYNFTKNFIENLALLNKYNIYIFGNQFNKNDFNVKGVKFIEIPIKVRNKFIYIIWELFLVNKYSLQYNINLTIYPRGFIPLFSVSKTLNIVHDLIPLYYYHNYKDDINKLENFYIRNRLLSSIKNSDCIISISQFTKNEILQYYPNKSSSIKVIYNGYNKLINNNILEEKQEYIVAVSSASLKHKNLKNIIKTYILYSQKVTTPLKLHLIGVNNLDTVNIYIPHKIRNNIILYNYVSDKQYIEIMKNAKIFLFLSLIEGFGFPPIEAMNIGTAVICSNATSLKEVVGNAGVLIDPNHIELIVEKIIFVSNNKIYRNKLIKLGHENIKRFEWKKAIMKYEKEITTTLNM